MPNGSTTDNSIENDGIPNECATAPTCTTTRTKGSCNAPHTRPPNPTPDDPDGSDDSSDNDDDDTSTTHHHRFQFPAQDESESLLTIDQHPISISDLPICHRLSSDISTFASTTFALPPTSRSALQT